MTLFSVEKNWLRCEFDVNPTPSFRSVPRSRAAAAHTGGGRQRPDAHPVHRDGHAAARGGGAGVERVCKVHGAGGGAQKMQGSERGSFH